MQTPSENTTHQLMTAKAAAIYLGLSPVTLSGWRSKAKGPRFVKMGRSVRYDRSDLDAFITSSKH